MTTYRLFPTSILQIDFILVFLDAYYTWGFLLLKILIEKGRHYRVSDFFLQAPHTPRNDSENQRKWLSGIWVPRLTSFWMTQIQAVHCLGLPAIPLQAIPPDPTWSSSTNSFCWGTYCSDNFACRNGALLSQPTVFQASHTYPACLKIVEFWIHEV